MRALIAIQRVGGRAPKLRAAPGDRDWRGHNNIAAARPIALRQIRNVFGLLYPYEARWRKRVWGTAANLTDVFYSEVGGS